MYSVSGLENPSLRKTLAQPVAFYHVEHPAVTKRLQTPSISVCIVHCMQTSGCYYIMVAMVSELDYICDVTSVTADSGLVFQDEENYAWKVFSLV